MSCRERAALGRRCLHRARPTARPGSALPSVPDSRLEGRSMTSAIFFSLPTFLFPEITECAKPKELAQKKKARRTILCTRWGRRAAPCPQCQMSRGRVRAHERILARER